MIYGLCSSFPNAAVRRRTVASHLGQLGAVRGETHLIDPSNSAVSSVFPTFPPRQNLHVPTGLKAAARTHVHVHPDAVLPADVRNGDEGVEGSVHRRPGGGAHEERNKALKCGEQTSATGEGA